EPRETAVDDDEIAVGHDHPGLVLERRGEAPDEGEQALAAGRDVGAVLDVARRPEPLGRRVVAPVEQRVEGLQHEGLVLLLCGLTHGFDPPSTRTMSLPKLRPSSIPMKASGALSRPSTKSSRYRMRPSAMPALTSRRKAG